MRGRQKNGRKRREGQLDLGVTFPVDEGGNARGILNVLSSFFYAMLIRTFAFTAPVSPRPSVVFIFDELERSYPRSAFAVSPSQAPSNASE